MWQGFPSFPGRLSFRQGYIRGPYRAARGGQPSPSWTAVAVPVQRLPAGFCGCGWSGPVGGQSARPDVPPGRRCGRGERARRPLERAGGGLRPARPRARRDLRGTDRLLRRTWPRPRCHWAFIDFPGRRNVQVRFTVFARSTGNALGRSPSLLPVGNLAAGRRRAAG
jgi:hypothetical protein